MHSLLRLLTSRKTTLLAVLTGLFLTLQDATVMTWLGELGVGVTLVAKLTTLGKLGAYLLAALGYSPLARPDAKR